MAIRRRVVKNVFKPRPSHIKIPKDPEEAMLWALRMVGPCTPREIRVWIGGKYTANLRKRMEKEGKIITLREPSTKGFSRILGLPGDEITWRNR